MNIDDEIDTIAEQAWHEHCPEGWDETEAYLRKHTFYGQCRELRDAWNALCRVLVHDIATAWLKLMDTLGM